MLWTDHNPCSPSPCVTWEEQVRDLGVKLSLGRREGLEEDGIHLGFFLTILLLIILKIISPR